MAAIVTAIVVIAPLVLLPLSFFQPSPSWARVASEILPVAVRNTIVLALGVAIGTAIIGTALAVLVSFYEFPLRRTLEWMLVLPLAVPAYILTFVLLGQYDVASPVQRTLRAAFGDGVRLPEIRTTAGAIVILTLVLYPYVYLLARASFTGQSRALLEAARTAGCSQMGAIRRVALPLARPAIAGGAGLAAMEAVADFGAVNLLNYRALTDAIYRVWYGAFDRMAALRLGAVLLGLVILLLALERISRRGRSTEQTTSDAGAPVRRRLRGVRLALALIGPLALLFVVVIGPMAQLVVWAIEAVRDGRVDSQLLANARNSILLAFIAATIAVVVAVVVSYAERVRASRSRRIAVRSLLLGYAIPGSVAAAAVFLYADGVGDSLGMVLTSSLGVLVFAYVLRFTALAAGSLESNLGAIPRSLDMAGRSLGAGRTRLLTDVHLPMLTPALGTAMLLVFVEVLKELPATALLRPAGLDTLSISIWEATKESLYETAALPALCLVAVGLVPLIAVMRLTSDRR